MALTFKQQLEAAGCKAVPSNHWIYSEGASTHFLPRTSQPEQSVQLLHMYGSDVNGGQIEWSAELERDAAGLVYLVLVPTVDDGVDVEAPVPVAIDNGGGLFDQLSASWCNCSDEVISEATWQEVATKVAEFDKDLGVSLQNRVREEYDPAPVPPSVADLWARRATWERTFNGRAVGYLPQEDIRRAGAVRHFVNQYQAQTGELPQGRHLIKADEVTDFWATFPDGK
jgi:hypothetical protein